MYHVLLLKKLITYSLQLCFPRGKLLIFDTNKRTTHMGHYLDNGNYEPNTVDTIKRACSEPDWDGYDAKPIPEAVLKNAEYLATADILPEGFEMFPCPDGSVQFEYPDEGEEFNIFEIYETEFIHSYRDGYTGFYAWEDFLRYIGTLDLKFCYPKHVHMKRIEGAI